MRNISREKTKADTFIYTKPFISDRSLLCVRHVSLYLVRAGGIFFSYFSIHFLFSFAIRWIEESFHTIPQILSLFC